MPALETRKTTTNLNSPEVFIGEVFILVWTYNEKFFLPK